MGTTARDYLLIMALLLTVPESVRAAVKTVGFLSATQFAWIEEMRERQ